jgi:hypothetical protein
VRTELLGMLDPINVEMLAVIFCWPFPDELDTPDPRLDHAMRPMATTYRTAGSVGRADDVLFNILASMARA